MSHAAQTDCRLRGYPLRKETLVPSMENSPFPTCGVGIAQAFLPSQWV